MGPFSGPPCRGNPMGLKLAHSLGRVSTFRYLTCKEMLIYDKVPPYRLTRGEQDEIKRILLKRDRYKNLVPYIDCITLEYYRTKHGTHKTLLAWMTGKPRPIPLPKREIMSNHSKKSRCLTRLRKYVEDQVEPLRRPGYHVDHIYPFEAIATDWLEIKGLDWGQVKTKALYLEFAEYHRSVAKYQYLTPKENISKGNKVDT
jgi:hypothetical protein